MFGIIYSLVMGCIYAVGGIKDDADNRKCKERYYNPQTGTYIDYRGCTRDYKTDEPRIVTSQWNKEKKRYEKIVLKNGTQIVKNITEEEDKRRGINNTQINKITESNKPCKIDFEKGKVTTSYERPKLQWQIDYEKRLLEEKERKKRERQKEKERFEMLRRSLER